MLGLTSYNKMKLKNAAWGGRKDCERLVKCLRLGVDFNRKGHEDLRKVHKENVESLRSAARIELLNVEFKIKKS